MNETAQLPELRLSDPTFSRTSVEVREARDHSWGAHTEWGLAVLRHDAVEELINDPRLIQGTYRWPDLNGVTDGPWREWFLKTVSHLEGADHDRLRKLINPALSPRAVERLAGRFEDLANHLIDKFESLGECEFIADFASPYASGVACILLGFPEEDEAKIAAWAEGMGDTNTVNVKASLPTIESALIELYGYVDDVIARRRNVPQADDAMSLLLQAEEEGLLSHDELRVMIVVLITGAFDTTRKQLGLAMQTLSEHPEHWAALSSNPDLADAAVNEVMRVNPTVSWVTREASADFAYRGVQISRGTTIHLLTESAGTDPSAGAGCPFDITARDRPRHFAFGGGTHYCAGHFLAKRDMSVALSVLARRLRNICIGENATWLPWSGQVGPLALPMSFESAQHKNTTANLGEDA